MDVPARMKTPTLILGSLEISGLLGPGDYLQCVEDAFLSLRAKPVSSPAPMHIPCELGGVHAKGAAFGADNPVVAVKANANFPGNPERFGLPTIQGAIILIDGVNGVLLAILDSAEITVKRTAAATALAARHLARADSAALAVVGCGAQAAAQVEAVAALFDLRHINAWDIDAAKAAILARDLGAHYGISAQATRSLADAVGKMDIVITCTPATQAFLDIRDVAPGTFVAAIGADNPNKCELTPALMAGAKVVVDSLDQCAQMGDLHHAIAAGVVDVDGVHAELSDIVAGVRPGRMTAEEICIFDSTGVGVLDAACARSAYARARTLGVGLRVDLAGSAGFPAMVEA